MSPETHVDPSKQSAEKYHRAHNHHNPRKPIVRIAASVTLFLALSQSERQKALAQQGPDFSKNPAGQCFSPSGSPIEQNVTEGSSTCLAVFTAPDKGQLSILRNSTAARSGKSVLVLEHDEQGRKLSQTRIPLTHPNFSLPNEIYIKGWNGSVLQCKLSPSQQTYETCIIQSTPQENPPISSRQKPSSVSESPRRTSSSQATCVDRWGQSIQEKASSQNYTCTWTASKNGMSYSNFDGADGRFYVVFNPANRELWWDYGYINPATFQFHSEEPGNAVSEPPRGLFESLSLFLTRLFAVESIATRAHQTSQAQSDQKNSTSCIQPPLSQMYLTQGYGHTDFARKLVWLYGKDGFHNGIDLVPAGEVLSAPIRPAFCTGTVVEVFNNYDNGCGSCDVKIKTGEYEVAYWHMDCPTNMQSGEDVTQSTTLGSIGPTDNCSTGPHLHLGLYQNGQVQDPLTVFPFQQAQ